jgi:hypothetical protein
MHVSHGACSPVPEDLSPVQTTARRIGLLCLRGQRVMADPKLAAEGISIQPSRANLI